MNEAVYFVVEKVPTGEQAALYHDHLPPRLSGKNAARDGLVYAVRMDTLPNAATWLKMAPRLTTFGSAARTAFMIRRFSDGGSLAAVSNHRIAG